ncbi:MAG: signal peptidase I [Acidobacteriota bacterium]|nr:signal peptidase I [Acidobacteriota bacterium]
MAKEIKEEKNAAEQPEQPKETTPEFIASIASVLVIGLFIITFCMQAFEIPTPSMVSTLLIGDHVFVDRIRLAPKSGFIDKLIPYRDPRRGDIVVFVSPAEPGLFVVKRVIGVPGDHIRLLNGVVYLNGVAQKEPYAVHTDPTQRTQYKDYFPSIPPTPDDQLYMPWENTMRAYIEGDEIVVPPGAYFGMGDNRDVSYDSRYWGFIPRENVVGRPMFNYWSFMTPDDQWTKTSIGDRLGFLAHIVTHFFNETRWSRMLHVVR